MSGSGNKKSGARRSDDYSSSEVEDLLRAAEDHLLINLRLNSHPAKSQAPFSPPPSSSSSYIDPDLARRFDALRSPSNPSPNRNPNPSKSIEQSQEKGIAADGESAGILGDDLAARFAALKGSFGPAPAANLGFEKQQNFKDSGGGGDNDDGDVVSEKEVEKLMEWAKDAARLDPSKKSDDDDDDENEEEEEEDDDSDDSEDERRKRKEKSKGKPKRWIFF